MAAIVTSVDQVEFQNLSKAFAVEYSINELER